MVPVNFFLVGFDGVNLLFRMTQTGFSVYFAFMKKWGVLFCICLLTGCSFFEKRLVKEFAASNTKPLGGCSIEGFPYQGISEHFESEKPLKVLMIHGIGTHYPGYSMRLQKNLAKSIGFDVLSRLPKNIQLVDEQDKNKSIGNLRISLWQEKTGRRQMLFYELTWSEITQPYKKILSFDMTQQYSKNRVPFNNMMKGFLDNLLPDPMIYLADPHQLILHSSDQALCWMLSSDWQNIPDGQSQACFLTAKERIKKLADENILFVTHSLGSEILMDTIVSNMDKIEKYDMRSSKEMRPFVHKLQDKKVTVFMMANQLPILLIDKPLPKVHNQIYSYCDKNGAYYNKRLFKNMEIVAFTDPNDILSYEIPQAFADTYIDSRVCPAVTNVSVNVAPEISAFGIGIVNPVLAHTNYDNSPKVIDLMVYGTKDFEKAPVREQCSFIRLEDDRLMDVD